jgi:hypothetical protein
VFSIKILNQFMFSLLYDENVDYIQGNPKGEAEKVFEEHSQGIAMLGIMSFTHTSSSGKRYVYLKVKIRTESYVCIYFKGEPNELVVCALSWKLGRHCEMILGG